MAHSFQEAASVPRDGVSEVRQYSSESQAKRKRGQENTKRFLRNGIAGDWKEECSREAREVSDRYAREELILMGYEEDPPQPS